MERKEVYNIIDGERYYQDKKWGGKDHDSEHSITEFIAYMQKYIDKAKSTSDQLSSHKTLDTLRKVVALGIAAFEIYDVPMRNLNK